MCKLCATSPNNVNVSWAVESGKAHTVSVYLVENLTYQDLLNRLVIPPPGGKDKYGLRGKK
jgi:hypothetical protein